MGLFDSWDDLLETFRTLASMLPEPVRTALGIASPSRVFAELGEHTADGLTLGLERGAGRAQGAAQGLLDAGALDGDGAFGRGAGGARGGIVIEQLTVQVGPGEDADETGQRIADALIEQFGRLLGTTTRREGDRL
jgi:hypothetical protein